jgi:hypothetical protein
LIRIIRERLKRKNISGENRVMISSERIDGKGGMNDE